MRRLWSRSGLARPDDRTHRFRIPLPSWIVVTFLVALAVRAGFVLLQLEFELFNLSFEANDSQLYRHLADSLRQDFSFARNGEPTAYVTPGFPIFLTVLFFIGTSTLTVALAHSVLGALAAVLLSASAFRVSGLRAAWATGLVAALYPHLVWWTGYVLTETLFILATAGALYLTVEASSRRTPRFAAGAGATFGLAALVRPTILGFAVLLGIAAAVTTRWRVTGAIGLGALALVMAPWVVRNAIVLDAPVLTSNETGYVLWQGNSPGATGGSRGYVDHQDFDPLPLPSGLSETERDRRYLQEAVDWMIRHPVEVATLAPKKLANMWRPTYEGASRANLAMVLATYPLLLIAAAYGLVRTWRTSRVVAATLLGYVAYHLLLHGLVTGMIRFRVPIEAVLCIPAGICVAALSARTAEGRASR